MRILTTAALCLLSLLLPGAETNDLSVAREALRDGLWEVARAHAAPAASADGKLIVLESWAGEGKWDEVGKCLKSWQDAKGAGFDYYRAVVAGNHMRALEILKKGGSTEGVTEAKMYEAGILAKSGQGDLAATLWREVATSTNVGIRTFAMASMNLMDAALLRRAYELVKAPELGKMVGLRLGVALLRDEKTFSEGEKLVVLVAKGSPDANGAKEAMLALADAKLAKCDWKSAEAIFHETAETWPDAVKVAALHEGRGWALRNLGRKAEALEAFEHAAELAEPGERKAAALVKVADQLQDMGRNEEALARYREVLAKFSETVTAKGIKEAIALLDLDTKGRGLYRDFKFAEAAAVFAEIAERSPARRRRMQFFSAMCLYGQGRDDEAGVEVAKLAEDRSDDAVRLEAMLWLAKFRYDRHEWKEAGRLFEACSELQTVEEQSQESALWAARASMAESDWPRAIQLTTALIARRPSARLKVPALLIQGEALIAQTRFDEAILVLEQVLLSNELQPTDRMRAKMLRADAYFALGADNTARYETALEAYREVRLGEVLTPSDQLVLAYKIARTLEKMKRADEALDMYYSQVVLAYRTGRLSGGRYTDNARAAFSRAAFRLADEFERRGRYAKVVNILELVVQSDVPAADEASRRIGRILKEGSVLP